MRIDSVEVIPYALPFREPYVTARGALTRRETALLRLRDSDGVTGLGEAVPLSLRGGTSLADVVAELESVREWSRLDPVRAEALSAPARCAALMALTDLNSRRTAGPGPSVADPEPVPCNATLVAGEPASVAADAERWAAEGFRTFKLKLGTGQDVAQVRAVREALGPKARIRADANAAWDLESAKRILAELEPYDVELVEEPVATLEEAAELAVHTSIPLAGDESIASLDDALRAITLRAYGLTGIKLSKVGGTEGAIAIAAAMQCFLSSALDGPVGIAAAAHVARALRTAGKGDPAHGLATQRLFASSIASVECELRDGNLHPPSGPGLGVEIDETALRAHRL